MSSEQGKVTTLEPLKRWLYDVNTHPSSGCVSCGNCYGRGPANWLADEHNTADWKCVPFDYYGWRRYTPSAFWELATRYYHGWIDIDEEVKETMFSCAQCGLCNEVCGIVQDGNRLSDIFKTFRFVIYEKTGPFRGHGQVIENIKKHGNPYGVGSPSGEWAVGLGLKYADEGKTDTLLFAGDYASYKLPNVAKSAAKVLKAAGVDYGVFKNEVNSGYYLEVMGDRFGAEELWKKQSEKLRMHGVRNVICLSAQDYHVLRRELGSQLNVWHITEFVSKLVADKKINPKSVEAKVTYHDPCYLARHAGSRSPRERSVTEEPRQVLRAIPGVEIVEMEKKGRWTWCAGECGGIKQGFPDLAAWRAKKLVEDAEATGVKILVTATPNEQYHLCEIMKGMDTKLQCADIMELLAQAV